MITAVRIEKNEVGAAGAAGAVAIAGVVEVIEEDPVEEMKEGTSAVAAAVETDVVVAVVGAEDPVGVINVAGEIRGESVGSHQFPEVLR